MTGASDDNPPPLDGLMAAAEAARKEAGRGPPPVHLWNPPNCGDIDIRIAKDGTWFHEKTPIGREALVRLFASILRRDPDGYWLVTPVEKMRITVDDAPFIAIRVDARGEALVFQTNVGDEVIAGDEHDLRVTWNSETGEPAPYLHVRRGLLARLSRPVFYELVALAKVRDTPQGPTWGVTSNGAWFPVAPPGAGF
jgi:hypothetical protein